MPFDTKTLIELRKITQAGIKDCQSSLEEASGNIEKAIEILRKTGALKAVKKADRIANEGVVAVLLSDDGKAGSIVQIGCETDFVAKGPDFIKYVQGLAQQGLSSVDISEKFEADKPDLVIKIGENIVFGGAKFLTGAAVGGYAHTNNKVGCLVVFDKAVEKNFSRDIAMHIAAANPLYIEPGQVPENVIEKEKEIYREQLKAEGKPKAIIEKILIGKLQKYYEDVCLSNQPYIKDDSLTVREYVEQYNKSAKNNANIIKFIRLAI